MLEQSQLEQYRALRAETQHMARKLDEMKRQPPDILTDTVRGSAIEYPFIEQTISITGYDVNWSVKLKRYEKRLSARYEKLKTILDEIEKFIYSIDDSTVRLLIVLRYVEGRTWRAAANQVFGHPCEDRARKRVQAYFKKN